MLISPGSVITVTSMAGSNVTLFNEPSYVDLAAREAITPALALVIATRLDPERYVAEELRTWYLLLFSCGSVGWKKFGSSVKWSLVSR